MAWSDGTWKVVDLVVKGVGAAVITGAITIYGMRSEESRQVIAAKAQESQQKIAEQARRLNTLIDITSRQKDLDINVGLRMFEVLMSRYLEPEKQGRSPSREREKMLLLRLIALNFQDVPINLKPLFEELEGQSTDHRMKEDLRAIAMEVARRQAFRLTFENGFDSGPKVVKPGETVELENLHLKMKVGAIARERVETSLVFVDTALGDRTLGPFSVTYFDTPILDNVVIGPMRVSVLLLSSTGAEARLRVVAFDRDFAADRFDISEIKKGLLEKTFR